MIRFVDGGNMQALPKVSELLRALKKDGWFLYAHGANHDKYRHPIKNGQLHIPRRPSKELAKGTYRSILRAAGLN